MAARISDLKRSLTEELPSTQFVGGFPKKHVSVLASAPGVGKTWFVLKTCIDLTLGGNVFFGLANHQPETKSLIMCGEGGIEMLVERAKALNYHYYPEKIAIYTQADLAGEKVNICLDDKEGAENLAKIIKGEEAQIVFIDTLIAFRSDDENASKETSRLLNRLLGIARKLDCAIVITHHTRKKKRRDTNETTQDDIIGSSAITRLCATAWLLTKEAGDTRLLRCVKTWWKAPSPITWRIQSVDGDHISLHRIDVVEGFRAHEVIREYLLSIPEGKTITQRDVELDTHANPLLVQADIEDLAKRGLIKATRKVGGQYDIMG